MAFLGAMAWSGINSSKEKLDETLRKSYFLLKEKDSSNSLLTLILVQSENPFKYKLTEEIYKKYPETEKEKQSHSRLLFRDLNLLDKYIQDIDLELSEPKCTKSQNPLIEAAKRSNVGHPYS